MSDSRHFTCKCDEKGGGCRKIEAALKREKSLARAAACSRILFFHRQLFTPFSGDLFPEGDHHFTIRMPGFRPLAPAHHSGACYPGTSRNPGQAPPIPLQFGIQPEPVDAFTLHFP